MNNPVDKTFMEELLGRAVRLRKHTVQHLLSERTPAGHWEGQLSNSSLSTATAIVALHLFGANGGTANAPDGRLISRGTEWLLKHQNEDGGWGDTDRSYSNISTTALVWAALGFVPNTDGDTAAVLARCEKWLEQRTGKLDPASIRSAIEKCYGNDRTFSIPILTMCALCGRLGPADTAWSHVQPLPFELAALPQHWFGKLRLPVVSYALPALIAIGQVRHYFRPTRNPVARLLRNATRAATLNKLIHLQPANGGFLEATPLTGFVTMSLAAMGEVTHPVTLKAVEFLRQSAEPDGSWAIDTNLATWVTTLSVNAISGTDDDELSNDDRSTVRDWLLNQQYKNVHPYTLAAPGGWAWTDLPGGVPDADDTAGAILALNALGNVGQTEIDAARAGIRWLLDLQNGNGGIPTFCRGWGKLPFDRSSPDITAHSLRAWAVWKNRCEPEMRAEIESATDHAFRFLKGTQRKDGSWLPLWFGHQDNPDDANPVYGTARVLQALAISGEQLDHASQRMLPDACRWLLNCQQNDGGWSGGKFGKPSLEETALAVESLSTCLPMMDSKMQAHTISAVSHALEFLERQIGQASGWEPAPIGFYFARLWYYERLYPVIFVTGALTRLAASLEKILDSTGADIRS